MAVMGLWAFILCTGLADDIKQKNKNPWNNTKQIFPEQKTKSFFNVFCVQYTKFWLEFGIQKYLDKLSIHLVREKCTFDSQSGNLKNYASGNHVWTSSCMLRIEKLITFNMTCTWTFHTNSLLHGYLFLMHVHK